MRGEPTGGAHYQIDVIEPGQRCGFRPRYFEGQRVGRRGGYLVADIGEGDEAVEQVIAVAPAADDMEVKIDLGRGEGGDRLAGRRRTQPPRSAGEVGAGGAGEEAGETGARPWSSFASIAGMSSLSGPNCSARRHW
jgi:hypothetical protein